MFFLFIIIIPLQLPKQFEGTCNKVLGIYSFYRYLVLSVCVVLF